MCVPAACLCIFDVDIHIGVYVFSITTAPYRGAKHGCHPCFPGTSAVAETAEMAGLLFEIRSWWNHTAGNETRHLRGTGPCWGRPRTLIYFMSVLHTQTASHWHKRTVWVCEACPWPGAITSDSAVMSVNVSAGYYRWYDTEDQRHQ